MSKEIKSTETTTPAIRLLPTSSGNVFNLEVNGVLDGESMQPVIDELNKLFEQHDKIRMLTHIKHLEGISPDLLMQSGLISMKMAALKKVERYAMVGAPGWMSTVISAMNPLFDMDMRVFEDEADAWEWVGASAVEV